MNRYAKGGIAVAAGAVLLLGGFGTFALWSQTTDLETGSVTSGELNITAGPVSEEWYVYDGSTDPADYTGTGLDLSEYTVVPKDELIYVAKGIDLSAKGGELYYTLGIDLGAAGVDGDGFTVGTPALHVVAGGTLPAATAAGVDEYDGVDPLTPVYSVVASDDGLTGTYDITVRVSFDADDTDNQNAILDLSAAAITVQQVIKN